MHDTCLVCGLDRSQFPMILKGSKTCGVNCEKELARRTLKATPESDLPAIAPSECSP